MKKKKEYEDVMRKKEEEDKGMTDEALRNKTGKKFWKMVGLKKRKATVCKYIREEEWMEHFEEQLGGPEEEEEEQERGTVKEREKEKDDGASRNQD